MPILNYTTSVAADQTAAQITKMLTGRAANVSTDYDEQGFLTALTFGLRTPHGIRHFRLVANVAGVEAALVRENVRPQYLGTAHARKVAWRILKDWLEAQIALVDADLAPMDELMLGYLVVRDDNTTMYEAYREREQTAIEGASR